MLNDVYRVQPDVVTRHIAGEVFLIPVRRDLADMQRVFAIEEVGAFIWSRLDGEKNLADLIHAVQEEFDSPVADLEQDVRSFTDALRDRGLVEKVA